MFESQFDVIVAGAGLAGLSCAAELVRQGKRPLLISETKEVATTLKSTIVAGNRAISQVPTWNIGWGGGWWMALVRGFNIPLRCYPDPGFELTVFDGTAAGEVHFLPRCPTASSLTDMLVEVAPWPVDAVRKEFESLMEAGLAIPYEELIKMERVPLSAWIEEQHASDMASLLAQVLLANITMVDLETLVDNISVFGAFGFLRSYFMGEAVIPVLYPDNRDGLAIPLARAIEQRSGEVWRGRRITRIITDGGVARGIVLEDGEEVSAPIVALAVGNSRIRALLDPAPPELEAPLARTSEMQDVYTYTVLASRVHSDRPNILGALDANTGSNVAFSMPMHAVAPWSTQPGHHLVVACSSYSPSALAMIGGRKGAVKRMNDFHEAYFPGFNEAIVEQVVQSHKHLWYDQISAGPKVPRTIDSIRNLWFVGEGSTPIAGVGFEAAASAGILGARGIIGSM